MSRRALRPVAAVAVGLAALAGLLATVAATDAPPPREIRLEAHAMGFRPAGGGPLSPLLEVVAGERVRLVLTNLDPGVVHDLAVEDLGFRIDALPGDGSSAAAVLVAPHEPGDHEYVCTFHRQMMSGVLRIVSPSSISPG